MTNQKLPAGISGEGIEVFRDNENHVFYLQNGTKLPYLMMPKEYRGKFQSELAADQTALAILKSVFGPTSADDCEEIFVGCRYGNLDYKSDLINGALSHDSPRCSKIESCKGFNIVCRIPIPKNGALTKAEYRIVTLIAKGKQTKEISVMLNIVDATTRTHTQRIHAKLGVNNNIEVAAWAHEHRII